MGKPNEFIESDNQAGFGGIGRPNDPKGIFVIPTGSASILGTSSSIKAGEVGSTKDTLTLLSAFNTGDSYEEAWHEPVHFLYKKVTQLAHGINRVGDAQSNISSSTANKDRDDRDIVDATVRITGNQDIAGIKTFSNSIVLNGQLTGDGATNITNFNNANLLGTLNVASTTWLGNPYLDNSSKTRFSGAKVIVNGNMYLSGNVSSSGAISSSKGLLAGSLVIRNNKVQKVSILNSHITASGNISSSGTIYANTFNGMFSGSSQTDHDAATNFVANEHIDHSEISVAAGTGLTGGGTIAANRTLNVIGGDGITANANDIAVTAAQTTITSMYATDLKIGEDAETAIDFETVNEIHFDANNSEVMKVRAGGVEITGQVTASSNISALGLKVASTITGSISSYKGSATDYILTPNDFNQVVLNEDGNGVLIPDALGRFSSPSVVGTIIAQITIPQGLIPTHVSLIPSTTAQTNRNTKFALYHNLFSDSSTVTAIDGSINNAGVPITKKCTIRASNSLLFLNAASYLTIALRFGATSDQIAGASITMRHR